ncbi:hypothetical protein F4802DRAFT_324457 [Xylaria palmicola]|nr:hypothetical protein F4802DRAFT_324457 [Xylaria palmicola]
MFFEGSLQDGISTALEQSKQVVCFVTNGESESQLWEDEFLTDDSLRSGLESQSVILRLPAGSEEAGYLEALFPIPRKPTVVVIRNGQLKEYIAAGTSKEEFIRRLGGTSKPGAAQSQPSSSTVSATPAAQTATPQTAHSTAPLHNDSQPAVAPASSSTSSAARTQPPAAAAATAADEEGEEGEEDARRPAAEKKKGKARAEAEEEARRRVDERCGSCAPQNAEQAHATEVKLRKHQANEERKRILKRIEDDKRARKEREAAERRARILLSAGTDADAETGAAEHETAPIPLRQQQQPGRGGDSCHLQVRLLDGSTIRARFAADETLAGVVRRWIDAERTDGDAPYAFRVVLTPRPNKVVEPGEEGALSLGDLGLAPSATLVLIPTRYSVAYAGVVGAAAGGLLAPVIGALSSLCGAIAASVGGFLALFFGAGHHHQQHGARGDGDVPMENLRARRRGDAQLYNGNSLNFEPRNEGDEVDENGSR